jgi:uncharacterized protein with FMN-binding domain
MRQRPITLTLITLATVAVLTNGSFAFASQQASHKPQVLTFIGSNAKIGINDNGEPGSSAGDIRTLALTLSTTAGTAVGTVDVVQTLTDHSTVDRAVKVMVISLPKGIITAQGLTTFTDFTNPAGRPNDRTEQLAVVGGTGPYRGAAGIVDIVVLPEFKSRWIISLD